MSCLLKLRDFGGERTNEVMRPITVIVITVHLQADRQTDRQKSPRDHFNIEELVSNRNVYLKVEPSEVFPGRCCRRSVEEL